MTEPIKNQTLYYGDCLRWMEKFPAECVDLIYLDPPFNSQANYNIIFGKSNGTPAQVRAFQDIWKWGASAVQRVNDLTNAAGNPASDVIRGLETILGPTGMLSYVSYMAERLVVMRKLLKPTGSIVLHCDPTASHYLKLVMDAVFGPKNFKNEIVWCYKENEVAERHFPKKHDVLLLYSKGEGYKFNIQRGEITEAQKKRYNIVGEGDVRYANMKGKKRKLEGGAKIRDWWADIPIVQSSERIGYPTQKPVALLKRIIQASTDEGDFVLDPFCGCGTAVIAAHELGRNWAGIDISSFAVDMVKEMRLEPGNIGVDFQGMPADLASARKLATENPFDFEVWAIQRVVGLAPNEKQTADGGIDGRGWTDVIRSKETGLVLAQVKKTYTIAALRDFMHVVKREKADFGVFITLDRINAHQAKAEAAKAGKLKVKVNEYPKVQLWSIEDYFDGRKPELPPMKDPYTGKSMKRFRQMRGIYSTGA